MAASATLHASAAGLVRSGAGVRSRRVGLSSTISRPNQLNHGALRVRCQSSEEKPQKSPAAASSAPAPSAQTPPPQPQPKMTKVSTKFSDVLAFSGPAPERINGRLAMIGFVSAIAVEAARGDDLFVQLANGGMPWFLGTAALLSAASLVPLFKGVTAQSKSGGLMTADAEMWNGRFAMVGLVALAFTEYLKGGPLV